MLTCTACGFANPLGTRWCRQCGAKLDLDARRIQASVVATQAAVAGDRLLGHGRTAIGMGGFLLFTALILRAALVPDLPPADAPPDLPERLLTTIETTVSADDAGNTAIASPRLRWRAVVCRPIATQLGLDTAALDATRERIAAAQRPDGTWAGSDPLAATALATLALQAWPGDATLGRATTARAWLRGQLGDAARHPALGRVLAIAALEDVEEMTPADRGRIGFYVVDGTIARWQVWTLAATPADQRPAATEVLRDALGDGLWRWYFQALSGPPPAVDNARWFTDSTGPLSGADRLAWVHLGWKLGLAPLEQAALMARWSREPVPPTEADLATAGGLAAECQWLLALAGAWRLPVTP